MHLKVVTKNELIRLNYGMYGSGVLFGDTEIPPQIVYMDVHIFEKQSVS